MTVHTYMQPLSTDIFFKFTWSTTGLQQPPSKRSETVKELLQARCPPDDAQTTRKSSLEVAMTNLAQRT